MEKIIKKELKKANKKGLILYNELIKYVELNFPSYLINNELKKFIFELVKKEDLTAYYDENLIKKAEDFAKIRENKDFIEKYPKDNIFGEPQFIEKNQNIFIFNGYGLIFKVKVLAFVDKNHVIVLWDCYWVMVNLNQRFVCLV